MREFSIYKNYYGAKKDLYLMDKITIKPGLTILCGGNGLGKSTLIIQIKKHLKELNIPFVEYDNLHSGGSHAISNAGFFGKGSLMASLITSSEGEGIDENVGEIIKKLGTLVYQNPNQKEFWVLLDGVDSGLSIDGIINLKEFLHGDLIEGNTQDRKFYIIISANTYEMCNGEQCFDVRNGEYITFADYNEYRNFIIQSAKDKLKRYEAESEGE